MALVSARSLRLLVLVASVAVVLVAAPAVAGDADDFGLVDPETGVWYLRTDAGGFTSFYYGNPGDAPFTGDWDCDGVDTPGLYRQSDGFVYLRNDNSQGVANIRYYFGNPSDVPLAGDFNGDGCDTVSLYRPTEARFYVINRLGSEDTGLGKADWWFDFGDPGDLPFVGDFDADGVDSVALYRQSTGFMYYRNTLTTGAAHAQFFYGDPGDRPFSGDWLGDGHSYPAVFRPSLRTTFMRHALSAGPANESLTWGRSRYLPVAGQFGDIPHVPLACDVLPANNIWNTPVDKAPVHARSDAYIAAIGSSRTLHADFGSGEWPPGSGAAIGIPYVEVDASQAPVDIIYTAYGHESDPGPMPIPPDAPIEGGTAGTGDRHVIAVDNEACKIYELYRAFPNGDGSWSADSGAVYDLGSNALRPDGWTSADAAGLPIYPGLVRYDEVASGEITHAIRFTAPRTQRAYVWPARHYASSITDPDVPPMGQRFRLKADFDISGYPEHVRVILQAFKTYGLVLADNGSAWYISGAPDPRWDNDVLHAWDDIPGSAFEAVDVSGMMVDPNSGLAAP